nr:helix-turn-helix domain-containing protein [uncultured Methanoregula sp.]
MNPPFDGLFGDTCETRLLSFLLPMYGIEFDMAELVDEIGLTRQSIAKAMKKFSDRGMVKIRKEGRTPLYSINEDSPLVRRLEDFDNSLIEAMVGPEEFDKIRLTHEKHEPRSSQKVSGESTRKAVSRYGESRDKAPCVASRPGTYTKERQMVIQ